MQAMSYLTMAFRRAYLKWMCYLCTPYNQVDRSQYDPATNSTFDFKSCSGLA